MSLLLLLPLVTLASSSSSLSATLTRKERFPSVEERIALYAGNWYHPPCSSKNAFTYYRDEDLLHVANTTFNIDIVPDQTFFVTEDILRDCARPEEDNATLPTGVHIYGRFNMRMYCTDVVEMVDLLDHHDIVPKQSSSSSKKKEEDKMPVLIQFGDSKTSHIYGLVELPHFKKFRSMSTSPKALKEVTSSCTYKPLDTFHSSQIMQPLIWKLATHRHYRQLPNVFRHDQPWEEKRNMAIFRGQLTGSTEGYNKTLDPLTNCQNLRRCKLVLDAHNSSFVDAKLTTTRRRLPAQLPNGVQLLGPTITIREMMSYKAIVMLEGNDVASGLKWALLSQSVVLMPPPKHTSWAMEELLEPWVHYIPLKEDASDIEDQMKWITEHDAAARLISQRGTLWMQDLVFHPNAAREERMIKEELLRRYMAHFVPLSAKQKEKVRRRKRKR